MIVHQLYADDMGTTLPIPGPEMDQKAKSPTGKGWAFACISGGDGQNRTADLWVMNPSL